MRAPIRTSMGKRRPSIWLFFCIALSLLPLCNGEIVELNDSNFEHQTQASTGMTTGSWFVLFKAERCAHCRKAMPEFQRLSNDEELLEKGIIMATVDVPSSRRTSVRFGIRGFPTLIFLHRGKMYHFKGQRVFDVLKTFLLDGVHKMAGEPIPEPMSFGEEFRATIKSAVLELYGAAAGRHGLAGRAAAVLLLIFVGILASLVALLFLPGEQKVETKRKEQ